MNSSPASHLLIAAVVLGLAAASNAARADGDALLPRSTPQPYLQECGACHTAYPPGLLPARSWQRIMNGLDEHYGSDAALDAAMVRQIDDWLQANAGTGRRGREEPPQDRITRSAWFEREHHEIDPSLWRHDAVKSAANCGACHAGADRGHYDDDELRLPKGLDGRNRRAWND
jgi:mono/diheme cytochrome c family protein